MIITDTTFVGEDQVYKCELIKQRSSYYFFGDKSSPTGNIVIFEAPTSIGTLGIDKALIVAGELPNSNMFGGICFQRLYSAQVGSIFAETFGVECYVDGSNIIVGDKQASICLTNRVKDSVLFHNIFLINSDIENLYHLSSFSEEKIKEFKEKVIGSFYHLTHSIFIESQRDNF
jgi:hypothetical protein